MGSRSRFLYEYGPREGEKGENGGKVRRKRENKKKWKEGLTR